MILIIPRTATVYISGRSEWRDKDMKKIISCVILCAMLLSLFPMSAFAQTTEIKMSEHTPNRDDKTGITFLI